MIDRYGKPTHPLPRKVRAAGARQEPTLEIRPPKIKPLLLVQSNDPAITGSGKPPLTLSAETTVGDLRRRLIQTFTSGDAHPPFRVWRLVHPRTAVTGLQYPTSRLLEVGGELLADEDSKTLEDVLIQSGDMLAIEIAQDGNWLVDTSKVPPAGDPEATQEELPPPLFTSENNFFNRMQTKSGSGPAPASSRVTTRDAISTSSAFSKYAPISRLADGGAKNRNPGTLGLGNM